MQNDPAAGLAVLEEGLQKYPALKSDATFFGTYLGAISRVKKKEAMPVISEELLQFEKKGNLSEAGYNTLIGFYTRDKRKEKVDSLTAAMKLAYPDGDWKKTEAGMLFAKEKDLAKKTALYEDFIRQFPPNDATKAGVDNLRSQLANAYAGAKDYDKFQQWNSSLAKSAAAMNSNNLAWKMAENDDNIELAKKMAYDATMYAKGEVEKPSDKKPEGMTSKQWKQQRETNYAMFGDTYAFILYKLGDFKTAYPIAKDAATINKLKDPEYNERYALLAEKTLPSTESKKLIEQFVKDGVASSKTKEALKNIYVKEKSSEAGFDTYLAALEADAKIKKRDEIAKSI
ncbi:MAG: hypothetical protein EOO03_18055, partial [Chitinophagaceae bacterium]